LIRILLDQGLSRSAADYLRKIGWDVIHTAEANLSRSTDTEILEHARQSNRILVTLDADFHALLAVSNADSPSVIRIRQEGLRGPELADLLEQVMEKVNPQLQDGALVTVTRTTIRIHRLPVIHENKR
jgi:predicted nuclease of predicted toxin-antitoxin system